MSILFIGVVFPHDAIGGILKLIDGAKRLLNFSHLTVLAHFSSFLLTADR